MYAKIANGQIVKFPYTLEDMIADNAEIVGEPTEEQLEACGAKLAQPNARPAHSSRTHTFEMACALDANGNPVINYISTEKPIEIASFNMRDARNSALTRCDWVITRAFEEGTPVPAAYLAYRQALRDLPSQPGFPYDYVWPQEPQA